MSTRRTVPTVSSSTILTPNLETSVKSIMAASISCSTHGLYARLVRVTGVTSILIPLPLDRVVIYGVRLRLSWSTHNASTTKIAAQFSCWSLNLSRRALKHSNILLVFSLLVTVYIGVLEAKLAGLQSGPTRVRDEYLQRFQHVTFLVITPSSIMVVCICECLVCSYLWYH